MAEIMNDEKMALLRELYRGAQLTQKNATALHDEAIILSENGRNERAIFLHQISLEECAKFEMIGHLATAVLAGLPYDLKEFEKKIRSHKLKNHTNAYAFPASSEEMEARLEKRYPDSIEIFKAFRERYHQHRNDQKNNSLYVNFLDTKYFEPADFITKDSVKNLREQNSHLLKDQESMMRVLERMTQSSDSYSSILSEFIEFSMERANEMIEDPSMMLEKLLELHLKHNSKLARQGASHNAGKPAS